YRSYGPGTGWLPERHFSTGGRGSRSRRILLHYDWKRAGCPDVVGEYQFCRISTTLSIDRRRRISAARVRNAGPTPGLQRWHSLSLRCIRTAIDRFRRNYRSTYSVVCGRRVRRVCTFSGRYGCPLEKSERQEVWYRNDRECGRRCCDDRGVDG